MDMTDQQLAELSKKGDDDAYEQLVHRHLTSVFNFARHYVRSEDDAEDITQDSFFKAWKHLKKYKRGKPFRPWLFAITRNTALDFIKKKKIYAFSALDDEDTDISFAENIPDGEILQPELFEQVELSTELAVVMEQLHPDHRSVLMLHYHEELSFEEIAEALGKPMNTVKSWHRRSLKKLRELMHQNRP